MLSREMAKLQMQTRKSDSCGKAGQSQTLAGAPRAPAAATDLSVLGSTRDKAGGWRGAPHSMRGSRHKGWGGVLTSRPPRPHTQEANSSQGPPTSLPGISVTLKKKKSLNRGMGEREIRGRDDLCPRDYEESETASVQLVLENKEGKGETVTTDKRESLDPPWSSRTGSGPG